MLLVSVTVAVVSALTRAGFGWTVMVGSSGGAGVTTTAVDPVPTLAVRVDHFDLDDVGARARDRYA